MVKRECRKLEGSGVPGINELENGYHQLDGITVNFPIPALRDVTLTSGQYRQSARAEIA